MTKPLSDVTVLELGMVMQVPLAGQMLGDYGAKVIKVERPPRGDIIRDLDEVGTQQGKPSCYYAAVGRNKRTVCLDLKKAEGREILGRLIDQADVLIHNFRPGAMERLGFDYDSVSKRNPRLIYAVSYGFGASGPLSHLPGQDMLAQSLSGMALNGVAEGERPRLTATPVIDYAAAVSLTQGILAALYERERSGKGDLVSTSLFDVAVATQTLELSSRSVHGYRTNWLQYSLIFKTKDGWLTVLTLFRENPLRLLCEAFGVSDMSTDPDLANASLQRKNSQIIYERFGPVIQDFSTSEALEKLSRTDILCAPVLDLDEAVNHAQTRTNGVILDVPITGERNVPLVGNPVRLNRFPPGQQMRPSELGENGDEILLEFGYSPEQVGQARASGVLR
jgi:crotonobetainyl-CoA:carnitine CoA-transferase CaiB-like acyl-CoA transferase